MYVDTTLSENIVDLDGLLKEAGLTKAELARRLGISANAVSKWRGKAPVYAVAYLELLVKYNRVRP